MNNTDINYQNLLKLVLEKGKLKNNRTSTPTLSVFGAQARFDLAEGFPLLTTKKVFMKGVIHELLWFLSGSTNIKYLVDNDVHIWDGDCYRKYRNTNPKNLTNQDVFYGRKGAFQSDVICDYYTKEEFITKIKSDDKFAQKWGDLGTGTYGSMWRAYPYYIPEFLPDNGTGTLGKVDQLTKVLDKLKANPDDRRMIVSAWHPYWVDYCTLPPCHVLFQFNTEELDLKERLKIHETKWKENSEDWIQAKKNRELLNKYPCSNETWNRFFDKCNIPKRKLNCQLYQRSADLFLGVPFNIASYALLMSMIAQVVNMVPGEFIHTFGDLHLYQNHIEQAKEQISRTPKQLPKLNLNPLVDDIFDFKDYDIIIENYDPHPAIKAEVSVG